jgi:hypothetical protein
MISIHEVWPPARVAKRRRRDRDSVERGHLRASPFWRCPRRLKAPYRRVGCGRCVTACASARLRRLVRVADVPHFRLPLCRSSCTRRFGRRRFEVAIQSGLIPFDQLGGMPRQTTARSKTAVDGLGGVGREVEASQARKGRQRANLGLWLDTGVAQRASQARTRQTSATSGLRTRGQIGLAQ